MEKANDLDILKELEKEIGIVLRKASFNQVTSFYSPGTYCMNENNQVTGLSLHNENLSEIPREILKLSHLKALDLHKNQIKDISPLTGLKKLEWLDLSWNEGISNYSLLKGLSSLSELYLSSNQIADISFLKGLHHLRRLVLVDNRISDISVLKDLPSLRELYLSSNQISDIFYIKDLPYLRHLDLRDNKIRELPAEIIDLIVQLGIGVTWDGYMGVILKGNPLETPPVEIVKKGKDAVVAYFRSLDGEERAPNQVKVLLVGEGGVGKTSLLKQLQGEAFNKNESQTHGIDIRDMRIKVKDKRICAHFWDFGGQEIMHATHQFFLSKRSLYILVLDGRKEEDAERWLKLIESFGGNSPILLAINKIDQNPGYEVNRKFLQDKYPSIKGFFRLSCKTGEGINDFFEHFKKQLIQIEHLQTLWPKNWFRVKELLEHMEEDYISYERYAETCNHRYITSHDSQTALLDFLHDLGIVVHFKEPTLNETNVINPKWLTEAVYEIINSRELAENKGILGKESLSRVLDPHKYPVPKHDYIIQLMKKFELCFTVNDHTILIPDLLTVGEPRFEFDYRNSLKFLLDYDFLPKSVMAQFIVKRHNDIKDDLRWRTGVVLEDKTFDSTAVIKADERDKKIYIYVNGAQKRDCFSVIRKTFREINESFEKIVVKEMVPLPDNNEIAIEYEELVGFEIMGKDEYTVGKLRKTYSIKKLLNGIVSPAKRRVERKLEYQKTYQPDGKVYVNIKQPITQLSLQNHHTNLNQQVHQKMDVNIDIKIDLPIIQEDFEELRDLLSGKNPELDRKLREIGDSLDEVTGQSSKKKLIKPMNKLGRLLKKLADKNSDLNKIISGTKKGIHYAQKLGKTYNKFAQWLALPQIPDVFL